MSKAEKCCCVFVSFLVVFFDQITKIFAGLFLKQSVVSIGNTLSLFYAENTGAAWSMFHGNATLLGGLGVGAMIFIAATCKHFPLFLQKLALAAVFGGVFGNTIDRFVRGYVVDFISIDLRFYRWPTFNVADSAICVGVVILLFTFRKKAQKAS